MIRLCTVGAALAVMAGSASGSVVLHGDMDVLGTGTYASDPLAGATVEGLLANQTTLSSLITPHTYPFAPDPGDHPGTDQIYVGSTQTGNHDGYSSFGGRLNGPQVIALDYASEIPSGQVVQTLTLGIAADDFQNPRFGQPFTASINGVANPTLTSLLNGLDQTGPRVQFVTIGIDPAALTANHVLTLSIDLGGNGGDGWAIDFLTVGVTTIPAPATAALLLPGLAAARRRRG